MWKTEEETPDRQFETTVGRFIGQHRLLRPDGLYLVGVSSGADSVALLLLLQRLGYRVEAAHCNFQLRGNESRRDEAFVNTLCATHDIPLHIIHFDTRTYAQLHKVSIEMAARELRYRYFEQLRCDIGANDVCVAHHQDDNVETILLNLLRGTGINGLTGMRPRHHHVVRPLLCASRQQILNWLAGQDQNFVTDSSNLVADVWRNKLRLNVLPQLLDITPQASQNILKTASLLSESAKIVDDFTSEALSKHIKDNKVSISLLKNTPSPQTLLFHWLTPHGFSSPTIIQITQCFEQSASGNTWQSATHELAVDRGLLVLQEKQAPLPHLVMPEPGTYVYGKSQKFRISLTERADISRMPGVLTVDADLVKFPLTLRPVAEGDRFVPLGMKKGSRLVSDFLTDLKLSLFDKRRQLLLVDASGRIVWIVGIRPDHRFRITDNTQRTLRAEVQEAPSNEDAVSAQQSRNFRPTNAQF